MAYYVKPRIRYTTAYGWSCSCPMAKGFGTTPMAAHAQWQANLPGMVAVQYRSVVMDRLLAKQQ